MRHQIISISKAKTNLLQLARKVSEEGNAYLLTRDGNLLGALVPIGDYEAMLETSDVIADRRSMAALRRALDDEKHQRLWKRNKNGQWTAAPTKTRTLKKRAA